MSYINLVSNCIVSMLHHYRKLVLYVIFGVCTTLINIFAFMLYYKLLGFSSMVSNAIAWGVAIIFAFITNKLYVFESNDNSVKLALSELGKFVFVRLFSGFVDMAIIYVGVDILAGSPLMLKILANIVVILLNYVGSQFLVFSKSSFKNEVVWFKRKNFIIGCVIFFGVVLRYLCILKHFNYDLESFGYVGEIVYHKGNVYAETTRYNYAPLFFHIQGLCYKLALNLVNPALWFRFFIMTFLILTDIGIFIYVYMKSNLKYAVFFFLNPISVIITGYHNQFDNMAVLLGLIAVEFMLRGEKRDDKRINYYDVLGMLFLALSLIMKHVLYAFPVWILLFSRIALKKKILIAGGSVILFFASFIPYWEVGHEGIINNVFKYHSFNNFPFFAQYIIHNYIQDFYIPYSILVFTALMMCSGYLFRKERLDRFLWLYFICLVCFASAIANQYLVIPCASLVLLFGVKANVWAYFICGGVFLMWDYDELQLYQIFEKYNIGMVDILSVVLSRNYMYIVLSWILFYSLVKYYLISKKENKSIVY